MAGFRFADSLRNLVSNLGTARDKASHSHYGVPTLSDFEATNAYRGAWLPRKIVDIPAMDATRNWRNWLAEADDISALEAEEKRLGLRVKVQEAMKKARLYGGAAIYIGTGEADPSKPLNPERIGKLGIRHLNVMTRRVLQAGEVERDPESPLYGLPSHYTLQGAGRRVEIHPSRLVVLTGAMHPDPETATGDEAGWGDSVLTAVMDAIKHADGTAANVASLVFEAKVDVFKIPGLMQGLADAGGEYERQLLDRLMLAATAKGINGALIMDAEESYEQKSANFAGLTDILNSALQIVSGGADIPVTRLLGQAPGGLNSSGESDIRNYYDRIHAMQELEVAPALHTLDECLIRSALGTRPEEVFYDWRSLWQTTDKERADIGKVVADTIKVIDETGLLPDAVWSKTAANMLVEAGIAPGLEAALEEFGDPDDGPDDEQAALGVQREPVTDAEPRPLYVHRKVTNAAEIVAWAREQGFEATLPADDMHVTIAFSRQPVDWMKAGADWASGEDGGLSVKPGGARLIERFDGGAVVLLFNSSELSWRHESIKEVGASWDYPDYQPHITLTYDPGDLDLSAVEPYRGAIELGPEVFEPLDEDWKSKVEEE